MTVTITDQGFSNAAAKSVRLPVAPGSIQLTYLTEGAANVIWALHFCTSNSTTTHRGKYVLRLRKDLPALCSTTTLQEQQSQQIAPLFASHSSLILPSELLELSENIVTALNDELHILEREERRAKSRVHVYHPSFEVEPFAQLLTNLFDGKSQSLEFKPKWLIQSPSAPEGAERCRTCALNAMRRSQGKHQGRGDSGLCPLDLLAEDETVLPTALANIWHDPRSLPAFAASFKHRVQPVLKHVRNLQTEHNKVGLDDFRNPNGKDLPVAMALRDCSVFLKVVEDVERASVDIVDIKLLDLDLKIATEDKTTKWAQMEAELIDGGWYFAARSPDVSCALGQGSS